VTYLTPTSPLNPVPECPVDYYEVNGFPQSNWQNGKFEAVRRVRTAWADRTNFILWIDTYPNNMYPYDEGPPDAWVSSISTVPVARQGKENYNPRSGSPGDPRTYIIERATYLEAEITIRYNTETIGYLGGIKVAEWIRPDTEMYKRDYSIFQWSGGTLLREGESPTHTLYTFQYVVKYLNIMAFPDWVQSNIGTCNTNTFWTYGLWSSFPPQTLLYQPPTIEATLTTGNVRTYNLTCYYRYRPWSWNYHWRQDTQAWEPVYLLDGTQYIQYPLATYLHP